MSTRPRKVETIVLGRGLAAAALAERLAAGRAARGAAGRSAGVGARRPRYPSR